jgi:hypothetical protein
MSEFNPRITLRLSIQRALLGEVFDRLVSVTCGLKGRQVEVKAYVSGEVTPDDRERISDIAGEVIADFPEGYMLTESCVSVEHEPEEMLDFWAFQRMPGR